MAKPAAPSTAINEVVAIPTIEATEINSSSLSIQETKLPIKGIKVGSTFERSMEAFTSLLMPLMIHKPISKVRIDKANFGA